MCGLPVIVLPVLRARAVDLVDTPTLGVVVNCANPALLLQNHAAVLAVMCRPEEIVLGFLARDGIVSLYEN